MGVTQTNRFVATVCSREKRRDPGMVPASRRYAGDHIAHVADIARQQGVGFLILSGKYGLIQAEDKIPYYDHLLQWDAVEGMVGVVCLQLAMFDVGSLDFYTKPTWPNYTEVMSRAASDMNIQLPVHELP